MKLSYKIFLLVLASVVLTITISTTLFFKQFYNHIKTSATNENHYSIDLFVDYIGSIQYDLYTIQNQISEDRDIKSTLNFLSNYETDDNNDRKIFDSEKVKLFDKASNITLNGTAVSIKFFKADGSLIFRRDNKDGKIVLNQKVYIETNNLGKIFFIPSSQSDMIELKLNQALKLDGDLVGYISLKYKLNIQSLTKFFHNIHGAFSIITNHFKIENQQTNIDFELLNKVGNKGYIEEDDKFINFESFGENDNKFFIVGSYSKNDLNKQLNMMFKGVVIYIVIFLIVLGFIVKIFVSKNIVYPLERLLQSVRSLQTKELHKIYIQGNDEISELAKEFIDISSQLHKSYTEAEQNNIFLKNVLDTVHMTIFIKDYDGRYVLVNDRYLKDCGKTAKDEVVGKTDLDLWEEKDALFYRQIDKEVMDSKEPQLNFEETQTRPDGSIKILITSKMPLINDKGEVIGILGVYDDITERKEKEKYLMQQSRLAQMGEMISMIAHQWRQPLNSISITTSNLMFKVAMNKFEKEFMMGKLDDITKYTQYLSSTIDDFRNFFKINKEMREIKLETIAEDCLAIIQTSLENNNITVFKDFNCNEKLTTYPNELRQVILNLLKNSEDVLVETAIHDKWVKISTYKTGDKYVIEVSDNGGGIDEKIKTKIFEPYFSTKHQKNGTGLGLYMSKTIVEDHCNGQLLVENNKAGAVFKVII